MPQSAPDADPKAIHSALDRRDHLHLTASVNRCWADHHDIFWGALTRHHHDWPHHLLVLMSQNVAMVHESRILQQVFFRYCEKSSTWICLCLSKLLIAHMGHRPANPHNRHMKGIYPHCLLVPSQIFWNFRRHIGTNVAMTATHPTICRGSLSIYTTVPVASL